MTQLTLRGFDREIERELRRVARENGISLNQAALKLLRRGAGLAGTRLTPIGSALDRFVGSLSDADAADVDRAVRAADEADLAAQRKQQGKPR